MREAQSSLTSEDRSASVHLPDFVNSQLVTNKRKQHLMSTQRVKCVALAIEQD